MKGGRGEPMVGVAGFLIVIVFLISKMLMRLGLRLRPRLGKVRLHLCTGPRSSGEEKRSAVLNQPFQNCRKPFQASVQ